RRQRSLLPKPISPRFAGQVRPQERRTVHTAQPGNAFLKRCSDLPHSRNQATPVVALPNRLFLLQRWLRATKHQFCVFFSASAQTRTSTRGRQRRSEHRKILAASYL